MSSLGMCTATLLADPMTASDAEVRAAVEAAVSAGFGELSVWAHQVDGIGDLGALGAHAACVEAAMAWAGPDPAAAAAEARRLADLASRLQAGLILAVTMEPVLADIGAARANLAALVDAAAEAGAGVCVEFLPWSGVPGLAAAWELVGPLGAGAGVLVDAWHWQRQPGGPCPDLLASIPGERIGYVQLCDAAPEAAPDVPEEAMSGRLLPGQGVVDFPSLLGVLDAIGAHPFVATEVFNPALIRERGARESAVAMGDAARRVLAARPAR